jgi:D-xylose transport system substrate-binding protein
VKIPSSSSLVFLLGLGLLTAACGGGAKDTAAPAGAGRVGQKAPPVKVGLLLDGSHERWQRDRDMIKEVVEDMNGELLVAFAEGDQAKQIQQAEQMLADGAKALIVVAHDTANAAPLVAAAKAKNVPVISYDRLIANADVDVYIGFDIEKIGKMQASFLVARAPKGNYVLLLGAETDGNAPLLRKGQMAVLEPEVKKGAIKIVAEGWTGWTAEQAEAITAQGIAKSGGRLAAVVASNDVTAGGAIAALEKKGLAGKVLVSGQDAELEAARRIVAGTQTMTVYKSLRTLTRLAARSAMLLAKGEKVDTSSVVNNGMKDVPTMLFDPIAVDKDNIDGILIADGFLSRDDVYAAAPAGTK